MKGKTLCEIMEEVRKDIPDILFGKTWKYNDAWIAAASVVKYMSASAAKEKKR